MKEQIEILFAALVICLFGWVLWHVAEGVMGGVLALTGMW